MEMTLANKLTDLTRDEKVLIWLRRTGRTFRGLGAELGLTGDAVAALLRNESCPTHRHRQLLELGVPEELLPPALDIKPGPKPKAEAGAAA